MCEKQFEVGRFQQLRDLQLELTFVKVYRNGQIQMEAYVLGWTPENRLSELKILQAGTFSWGNHRRASASAILWRALSLKNSRTG
ncbi:nuclease A inhibitor family protein [Rufibacter aurantiacus]|uniref:nuclease A inhibitor family protein n=1 Tax=Rufibacter aurantiacus TaxID=2817374 RepID=UPI001B3163B4